MKISIIGCGWLGLPMAQSLSESGHQLTGSTTTPEKMATLKSNGISPVLFKLNPMPEGENFNALFKSDLVIINIPPGRKKNKPEFYQEQIKYLKYQLQQSDVNSVIFISSTSYYPNTNGPVNTETKFDLALSSSEAVVKGEQQISEIEQDLIILRCGGLMGGDRIPGRWFSGKPVKGADTPVNYVHREDIIRVVSDMIENWPGSQSKRIFNLVSDQHPTRKEVYEVMAKKYGFAPPVWEGPSLIPSKIVESDFKASKLKSPLDF